MKRILYVEDNEDTADAVKLILNNAGFDTKITSCGKDALKIVREERFDLFLLDIMLPDMSGWDIFEKLKKKDHAKFAFLSAIPISNERMRELKKVGVSDYITKPFEKDDLVKRVKKIVGK